FIAKFHILSVTIKYMIVCHIPKSKNYRGIEGIQPPGWELIIQFLYAVIVVVKFQVSLFRLGIFHLAEPAFKTEPIQTFLPCAHISFLCFGIEGFIHDILNSSQNNIGSYQEKKDHKVYDQKYRLFNKSILLTGANK